MTIEQREDGYWVIAPDDPEGIGPSATQTEAREDRQRARNFVRHEDEPGYVTCESRRNP